ncbi:hypothetical protein H7F37_11885 [Winogradskyella sp. PAMC22761]|nr:hypothetical protein H7F37_11885 [Winogradskyella sp. PAMC22761]
MSKLDKYIIGSSIFALFTEDFSFNFIIDIKLFYFIIIVNSIFLIYKNSYVINKNHLLIILFLLIHGILTSIFINDILGSLFSQILGISISSFFYYNLLRFYGKDRLFETYLNFALIIAILALPMFYLRINVFADGGRLNGILNEPAHYAAIMLPATFMFFKRKNYFKLILIVITILLSKSTIGYFGLLLIILIPMVKLKYLLKYIGVFLILSLSITYYLTLKWHESTTSEDSDVFVRRIKETSESLKGGIEGEFKDDVNLSTYALLSNSFITKKSLTDYPLGSGLGSYSYQYEKYYPLMHAPKYLVIQGLSEINKFDANSLFLRFFVDLGIFAIFFFTYFVIISVKLFKQDDSEIRQATFFYLIVKLIREGHYFPPEFYFFLLIFVKNFDENITYPRKLLNN